MAKLDPTFNAVTITSPESWRTPDFNPNYGRTTPVNAKESTRDYNKAVQDSFKAFGVYANKNVNEYLDKLSSPEGMMEETLGGSGLSGVGGIAGTMIGKNAQTFNWNDANFAEELKALGYSARDIWEVTQNRIWNSGIRQEIDDSVMKVKDTKFKTASFGSQYTRLGDLIEHNELFKAYPDLKNAFVIIDDTFKRGEAGYTKSGLQDHIVIGADKLGKPDTTSLLHEIQHAIQQREGWQGGGNPENFGTRKIILPNGTIKEVDNFTQYETLAGEWEARITQARAKLTPAQRKKYFPDDWDRLPSGALNVHSPKYSLPIKPEPKKK